MISTPIRRLPTRSPRAPSIGSSMDYFSQSKIAGQYSQKARKRAAKRRDPAASSSRSLSPPNIKRILAVTQAGSRIPASVREDFLNSAPAIFTPAGPITYRMSCWFPGKLVGGILVPDPTAIAEVVTGTTEAPEMGPIPDPSVTPEDKTFIRSLVIVAVPQVKLAFPLVLPYLRHCSGVALVNSHCPVCLSYINRAMSGIGDVCVALPVANDAEISPFIQELKDFDVIKAATPNTLAIGQTQDTVALLKVPDNASTAEVNTVAENTQLQTSFYPSTPTSVWATPEETISGAGSSAPVENSVRSSSPDASPVGLEPKECISERAASAGARSEENQQRTPPPSTENPQPIDPTVAPREVGIL